jgi:hypothetical protein
MLLGHGFLLIRIYVHNRWGYKGRGKSRSEEKSKGRTFPLRLNIPRPQRDVHFSHRPGYGGFFNQPHEKLCARSA